MEYYAGLDVSLKSTHICVMGGDRRVVWQGVSDTQIEMISARLVRWGKQIKLVGLETGSLTPWLYHGLCGHGLPMVCMDARPVPVHYLAFGRLPIVCGIRRCGGSAPPSMRIPMYLAPRSRWCRIAR